MTKNYGLIADIGGTNARFALADKDGYYEECVFPCADFEGPAGAVEAYLEEVKPEERPRSCSFAIAGPVQGDVFFTTNMPWTFSISDLRRELQFESLALYNDFEAVAMCIPHLKEGDFHPVGGAQARPHGPIGVLGPGTGLGVASLFSDGRQYHAVPGEGGHVTIPSKTQREFDVVMHLYHKYRHVSAERVCSGKGLVNVYDALRAIDGRDDLPDRAPREISQAAQDGSCEISAEALDMMVGFLGRVAGNLALTLGAYGGIYIAGGIVLKLGDQFDEARFREEFEAKGRFEEYMKAIPTFVISHPFPAFLGLQAHMMIDQAGEAAA